MSQVEQKSGHEVEEVKSTEELKKEKDNIYRELDQVMDTERPAAVEKLTAKAKEIFGSEEDVDQAVESGIKPEQKSAIEAIDNMADFATFQKKVLSIDTSRIPFADKPMKQIKEMASSQEANQLVVLDQRIQDLWKRSKEIDEKLKVAAVREQISNM